MMSLAHRLSLRTGIASMSAKGKTPRNLRNNNPGNLQDGHWTRALPGYTGADDEGFAVFKDWHYGLHGLERLLRGPLYRNLTLTEAIARYAPRHENPTDGYQGFVASWSGLDMGRKVGGLDPFELHTLTEAMIIFEGWPRLKCRA